MTADETPEEEQESPSRAAGGCALLFLGGIPLAAVFAVSSEAGVLATVGATVGAVWWFVRRVPRTANPAPPPPSEGADDKKPQFTVMADETNPHRSRVVWHAQKEA
ncbi:hypothetical protein [Streptomyces sp. NPDC015130]|uniref:hypothetical protein n=1 Tax=Streptomyces sp. NPDC015130 TaxID=3364940 RepID=UPI003700C58E